MTSACDENKFRSNTAALMFFFSIFFGAEEKKKSILKKKKKKAALVRPAFSLPSTVQFLELSP